MCTSRACCILSYYRCLKAPQLYLALSINYKDTVIKIRWRCIHSSHLKQALQVPFLHSREGRCEAMCHSEAGRRGRNTVWARSQPLYPWGPVVVLQPSLWSVFLDCLNIFVVITFTFTFQSYVSVFCSVSHRCLSPWPVPWISSELLRLEEPLHTRRRMGLGGSQSLLQDGNQR